MIYIRETSRIIRIVLILWLLVAIIYPFAIFGIGQTLFNFQANGSIRTSNFNGKPIGSVLIGQQFITDKYFHSRPSVINYAQGNAGEPRGISGGSNLSPGDNKLIQRIKEELELLQEEDTAVLPELIYASGSGLDPHISLNAAIKQLPRVASSRNIRPDEIFVLLQKYTDKKFLGIFGEPGINILRLNYALDVQDFSRQQN